MVTEMVCMVQRFLTSSGSQNLNLKASHLGMALSPLVLGSEQL